MAHLKFQLAIPLLAPGFFYPELQQPHEDSLAELASLAEGLQPFEKDFGGSFIKLRIAQKTRSEPLLRGIQKNLHT